MDRKLNNFPRVKEFIVGQLQGSEPRLTISDKHTNGEANEQPSPVSGQLRPFD